jgi:hypothetical protein
MPLTSCYRCCDFQTSRTGYLIPALLPKDSSLVAGAACPVRGTRSPRRAWRNREAARGSDEGIKKKRLGGSEPLCSWRNSLLIGDGSGIRVPGRYSWAWMPPRATSAGEKPRCFDGAAGVSSGLCSSCLGGFFVLHYSIILLDITGKTAKSRKNRSALRFRLFDTRGIPSRVAEPEFPFRWHHFSTSAATMPTHSAVRFFRRRPESLTLTSACAGPSQAGRSEADARNTHRLVYTRDNLVNQS